MGKILRTVNLIVNAMKPKQITWSLDEYGSGYYAEEKVLENEFDIKLENPQAEELDTPFETYCTDNGVPWSGPKKEEKLQTNITNPKLPIEVPEDQKIDELKTFRAIQETLASKLKVKKTIEKENQTSVSSIKNSRFTTAELAREKKADLEMRKRLQLLLKKLKPKKQTENKLKKNISNSKKCRFTTAELAREKKIDLETRNRLKGFLEKIKTKKEKDIATLFDPIQGVNYYLNRYDSEPAFKAWFDTSFQNYTIEQVLELAIPATFLNAKPNLNNKNAHLQKYIDMYFNEPMYKDWFDRKYPGLSIYDVIGIPDPQ